MPRLPAHLVRRRRLLACLDEQTPLTLLRAPIGFGKTTLVAQWVAEQDPAITIAWSRVRRGAGAARSFWREVLQVLADAGVALPSRESWPEEPHQVSGLIEGVLRTAESPVTMVIDGFDHLADDDVGLDLLDLLRHTAQLRLIVCLRGHHQFPAHQRLDIETTTIRASDLRFTIDEASELFAGAGVELAESSRPMLYDESGGWPEPTRAFLLRLRETPTVDPDEIAGIVNGIATDYLRHRLLPETQHPDKVEFAVLTSLPEDFTAEVAELLTGNDAAKVHLDSLVGDGVLSAEIRESEAVYRWPPAARRALEAELRRQRPERLAELHSRLSRWYLDADQPGRALDHAVQAGDWPLAVRVIDSSWRALTFERPDDLYTALVAIPLDAIAASPRALAVRDAWLRVPDKLLQAAVHLPEPTAELESLGRSDHAAEAIDVGLAALLALRLRGWFGAARVHGERLLKVTASARAARPSDMASLYPSVHVHVGTAQLLGDDHRNAQETLHEAYRWGDDDPLGYVAASAAGLLALSHASFGHVEKAGRWIDRHEKAPLASSGWEPRIRIAATVARLLVALDGLDLDTASAAASDLRAHSDHDELWSFLTYAQAMHALHAGTESEVLDRIAQVRAKHGDRMGQGAAAGPLLAVAEGALLLGLGRGTRARAVLYGNHPRHPLLRTGQARLALLAGENQAALALATDTGWDAVATPRHRLDMLLIGAVAGHRLGLTHEAAGALRRAADVATATGSLRAFTTVPRRDLATLAAEVPPAEALLMQAPLATSPELFPPSVDLIDLTPREKEVLQGIAAGLTAQQIANGLTVSYSTIRTQQRSLYKKLGTSDRSEALVRARQLGLLAT